MLQFYCMAVKLCLVVVLCVFIWDQYVECMTRLNTQCFVQQAVIDNHNNSLHVRVQAWEELWKLRMQMIEHHLGLGMSIPCALSVAWMGFDEMKSVLVVSVVWCCMSIYVLRQ